MTTFICAKQIRIEQGVQLLVEGSLHLSFVSLVSRISANRGWSMRLRLRKLCWSDLFCPYYSYYLYSYYNYYSSYYFSYYSTPPTTNWSDLSSSSSSYSYYKLGSWWRVGLYYAKLLNTNYNTLFQLKGCSVFNTCQVNSNRNYDEYAVYAPRLRCLWIRIWQTVEQIKGLEGSWGHGWLDLIRIF